jgi:hypothetical protein
MKEIFAKARDNYTLYGAFFGCCFPVIGTMVQAMASGQFSLAGFVRVQITDPLLWIIDSAPLWLGIFARLAGMRQDRVNFYVQNLEKTIAGKTNELLQANKEMNEIMRNIPLAVFTINSDLTINKGCSSYFLRLSGKTEQEHLMFPHVFGVDNYQITLANQWARKVFAAGKDQWATHLESAPLKRLDHAGPETGLTLAISYHPIYADDVLEKILVIVSESAAKN